ncbi:MAG: peptidase M4 [bacterium]|nr:peptidase M4 [bacterium]
MTRTYRTIHRYLGLIIGIQLLLWTASGFFFSLNPIEKVRGESEMSHSGSLKTTWGIQSPEIALKQLEDIDPGVEILSVMLRPHLDDQVYEISYRDGEEARWALADPRTGLLRDPLSRGEAVELARKDFLKPAMITEVELLSVVEQDSEYRGRPLPAYRVSFDHPLGTRVYVSVDRGLVTARRNDRWRWFDLMWMFHIMDFDSRDDFNTILLQLVSGLGLVTVLSGFVLAGVTSPRLRRWLGKSTLRTASASKEVV